MNHPALHQPTTLSIGHTILQYPDPTRRDSEWSFPYTITTDELGATRAPHHAMPYIKLFLENSSLLNASMYFARIMTDSDLSQGQVTSYLRSIANYRKRCIAAGGGTIQPSERELEAFMELFWRLVPKFHGHQLTFDVSKYKHNGIINPEDQIIGPNDLYSPETIARWFNKGAHLTNSPEEQALIRDIDGLMTVLGNIEIQVLHHKLGGVLRFFPPLKMAQTMASTFGVLSARSPIGVPLFLSTPDYRGFGRIMQAFGQAALDWGVDQPNFNPVNCYNLNCIKNATSLTMKCLSSVQGKLEGLPRFKDFHLSEADLNNFNNYLVYLDEFAKSGNKIPPQAQALKDLLENPDIQHMLENYEERFGIRIKNGYGVVDTNLDIEPLLCRVPGQEKYEEKGRGVA